MVSIKQVTSTFGRFLTVGLAGTLLNLATLWLLVNLGLDPLWASLLATEVSIVHNFLWNDSWTFGGIETGNNSKLSRFGRFQLITSFTAGLSFGLFSLFHLVMGWHYLAAQMTAIGLATVLNFVTNSRFTWNRAGAQPE